MTAIKMTAIQSRIARDGLHDLAEITFDLVCGRLAPFAVNNPAIQQMGCSFAGLTKVRLRNQICKGCTAPTSPCQDQLFVTVVRGRQKRSQWFARRKS